MTARAERRRQATRRAMVATVVALVVVVAAGVVGATALYQSTDGAEAGLPDRPVRTLPTTPNLLVGVVDERQNLASVAVFTDAPDRSGGSIVSVATNSAMTARGEQVTMASRFDGSPRSLSNAAGSVLGVTFQHVVVLDERQLADALPAIGDVEVDLPADVVDDVGVSGHVPFQRGEQEMSVESVAEALAARAGSPVAGADEPVGDENDVAVWSAIAAAIGDGVELPSTLPDVVREGAADVIESLYGGEVGARGLGFQPREDNTELVNLVRSDVLLVFGQVSPRQVAAPAASVNVRLVARFPEGSIEGGESADVASRAIDRLILAQANVVSVDTGVGEAPTVTRLEVVTRGTEDLAGTIGAQLFGESTVETTDYDLRGVDLVVTLGETFLGELERAEQTGG